LPGELSTVLHVDRQELEALAEVRVSIPQQKRLDALPASCNAGSASPDEMAELDQLLERVDRLSLLKAKASLALQNLANEP
jgi:hypothetical protein